MDHDIAIRNLVQIRDAFKGKAFLLYGSALGAIREQKIIAHDKDTDMGVFEKDFDLSVISNLCRHGFNIGHVFGMRHYGMELAVGKGGVKTDLWVIYESPDRFWNALWDNKRSYDKNEINNAIVHAYSKEAMTLQKVMLYREEFMSPGEKYLEETYGPDWRVPKVEFNWRTDHACIQK